MKLAHIGVKDHGEVVTVEYAPTADADAPDLTGFMKELAPEIVAKMGYGHKPMIYKDSHGVWDEVLLDAGEFAGFRSLGVIQDRDQAIKRAIQLRSHIALAEAADDEAAKTAIDLLAISKDNDGRPTPVKADLSGPMSESDVLESIADGLVAVVQSKVKNSLREILRKVLDSVPADKRDETFAVLDKVRAGYEGVVDNVEPAIQGMLKALVRGQASTDESRKAAEEAKTASKH